MIKRELQCIWKRFCGETAYIKYTQHKSLFEQEELGQLAQYDTD